MTFGSNNFAPASKQFRARHPQHAPTSNNSGSSGFGDLFSAAGNVVSAAQQAGNAALSGLPTPTPQPQPLQGDFNLQNPGMGEIASLFAMMGLMGPGQGEMAQGDILQRLMEPGGPMQDFNAQYQDQFMSQAGGSNPLNQTLDDYRANRPDLATDPNLGAFYNRATERGLENVNAQAAARGAYGSSAALNQGTDLISNLEADRASKEAQYGLDRAEAMRLGAQTEGNMAGMLTDAQRLWATLGGETTGAAAEEELARNVAAGTMAGGLDAATRARLGLLTEAGLGGQQAREGRIGGMFGNLMGIPNATFGPSLGFQEEGLSSDQALFDLIQNLDLGIPSQKLSEDLRRGAQKDEGSGNLFELLGSFGGGGLGGA